MSTVSGFQYINNSPFRQRIRDTYNCMEPGEVIGMLRAQGKRWIDICEILHCNMTTIHRHIRKDDLGFFNETKEGKRIKSESAKRFQAKVLRGEVPTYKRGGWAKGMYGFCRRRK